VCLSNVMSEVLALGVLGVLNRSKWGPIYSLKASNSRRAFLQKTARILLSGGAPDCFSAPQNRE
jgi:hypothetical protein